MSIVENLAVMLARRKMRPKEIAERIGITERNVSLPFTRTVEMDPVPVDFDEPAERRMMRKLRIRQRGLGNAKARYRRETQNRSSRCCTLP
jgi:DNA-binding transcriptional regulator LsrR (DeoR family)